MNRIVVASRNPVKVRAVLNGFKRMFPDEEHRAEGISVESGVSNQPMSDKETRQGAINRAKNSAKAKPKADYWVGIEGGVKPEGKNLCPFAWVVVKGKKMTGKAKTEMFYLPEKISKLVREGKELGEADDIVFGTSNSKQKNGTIGMLTGDVIDRTRYYEDAVVLALIPFKNRELYCGK